MRTTNERRRSRRFPVVGNAAVVVFKQQGRSRIAGANVVNISQAGALLLIDEKPGLNSTVHIRLEYPIQTPWTTATVMRLGEKVEVGIAFTYACNRTFFWTATRGADFHLGYQPASPEVIFSFEDSEAGMSAFFRKAMRCLKWTLTSMRACRRQTDML